MDIKAFFMYRASVRVLKLGSTVSHITEKGWGALSLGLKWLGLESRYSSRRFRRPDGRISTCISHTVIIDLWLFISRQR